MSSWNVIVCGDLEDPVCICIPDPNKWTVTDLKKELSKQISIPETDLVLYCDHSKVPEEKPLKECNGMKNAVALLLAIKPIMITVYCSVIDCTLEIVIPRYEYAEYTVSTLRSMICFQLGFSTTDRKNDVLAVKGEILKTLDLKISSLSDITDTVVTYTLMDEFELFNDNKRKNVLLPFGTNKAFSSTHSFYKRSVRHKDQQIEAPRHWMIILQQQNGLKTEMRLGHNPEKMAILTLRENIKQTLSIPTHQQKLYFGDDIILEDWDEDGNLMLIAHYPLYNNITINVVQLTEGMHVCLPECTHVSSIQHIARISSQCTFYRITKYDIAPKLTYINILDPSTFSMTFLFSVMRDCACSTFPDRMYIYLEKSPECFSQAVDKPLSSFKWITDGCTLTFDRFLMFSEI